MKDRFDRIIETAMLVIIALTLIGLLSTFAHAQTTTFKLYGPIKPDSYIDFKEALTKAEKANTSLTVRISSPGGWLDPAEHIIQEIKNTDTEVICINDKMAASAAFLIFIYCDTRIAKKGATFMWHQIRTYVSEPMTSFFMRWKAAELEFMMLYYAQEISYKTNYTVKEVQSNVRYVDWYIYNREALRRGLIDKVLK